MIGSLSLQTQPVKILLSPAGPGLSRRLREKAENYKRKISGSELSCQLNEFIAR